MPGRYDPDLHQRRSVRLRGYEYAQAGAYFVTICTWDRGCLFGSISEGVLSLSAISGIVVREWLQTAVVRPAVTLDHFVVMPNHFHGIVLLDGTAATGRATQRVAPTIENVQLASRLTPGSLGAIVGQFKAVVTKCINELRGTPGAPVWQRGYHEHVIRNEPEPDCIREYIIENPTRWAEDRYHVT